MSFLIPPILFVLEKAVVLAVSWFDFDWLFCNKLIKFTPNLPPFSDYSFLDLADMASGGLGLTLMGVIGDVSDYFGFF